MKTRDGIASLLLVLLLAAGGGALWTWQQVRSSASTPGVATTLQEFEIAPGSSLRSVLKLLQEKQLIRDAKHLEWYLRCCRKDALGSSGIQAGRYRIVPGGPPLEILKQLVEGRVVMEQVTVVEGWTFSQMRQQLARTQGLVRTLIGRSEAEIMAELGAPDMAAEGRFAPDTYSYSSGVTTDMQLLRMAFEAQRRNLAEAWDARVQDLPIATPDEALTLASIVEKETGLASERARVAGVFVNRLRTGMRLQSDPTVIYGIRARYDGNIRRRDLTTDTPYNTYTRAGLPPTPIALPGRDAIVAVLNPEKSDALYFVAIGDGSGGHYFSTTYAEHQRALQRYLERLRAGPLQPDPTGSTEAPTTQLPVTPAAGSAP